jgi:hypothetical protein
MRKAIKLAMVKKKIDYTNAKMLPLNRGTVIAVG